ncbi:uracil-xanthine permease family protein [Sodalis sp. CWE]|uniref:uracil-xanthine permease family protein n=1 Tax=Sodalis sp. CWE TaxID=2803816 RepID=UPI001C7D104F|nr:uracil-xanthine permease family protein [Sodalis sp. CWE]MBX4180971.1 uracil-xanthine permease [Sodalis sp. CWE]
MKLSVGASLSSFKKSTSNELIYGPDDQPPLIQTLFAACQHLLAMFVAVVTPSLLICQALSLPEEDTCHIISMSLISSGLASILQIRTWGPVGSGLLSIQGTSFNFVTPLVIGGLTLKNSGVETQTMMATLFGTLMVASFVEIFLSRILHLVQHIITPLVSGIVVMIIGISLIQISSISINGNSVALSNHIFDSPKSLVLAIMVLLTVVFLNLQRNSYLRAASLLVAILIGYILSWIIGVELPEKSASTRSLIIVPKPLYYGLDFDWNLLIPLMLVFFITSVETIGDISATSDVSEQPIQGPLYIRRLKGGVLANGLNSMLSAILNAFPNSCFSQNNGVIQLTGIASRYIGFIVSIMLIILGLFPAVSATVQYIPNPVLGAITMVMFGIIAASGVRIISRERLDRRAIIIIALSLSIGLGVSQQPFILQHAPQWLRTLLSSSIASGGIAAVFLNFLCFPKKEIRQNK